MNTFSVQLGSLAGFRLDLQDLGTNFTSNAARLLSSLSIPAGSTGLLSTLAPSFEKLQSTLSSSHERDSSSLSTFGADLATAGTEYLNSDTTSANALAALSADETVSVSGDPGAVNRFSGLQLPTLPVAEDPRCAVRQVVDSGIELLSPYDDKLSETIGMKPAADYLTPLAADWEALQPLGSRIGQLGINDFVSSQNITGGIRWLQSTWTGSAADAFATSTTGLGQSIATRSDDLDEVSKIVQNGGAYLERLVYNQAVELSSALAQPMTFLDMTMPLSGWAQLINNPMRDTIRTEIVAAVDSMKRAADSKRDAIVAAVDRISTALDYSPGRTSPIYNSSEFELPEKAQTDLGARRYGFGGNVWWEATIASA